MPSKLYCKFLRAINSHPSSSLTSSVQLWGYFMNKPVAAAAGGTETGDGNAQSQLPGPTPPSRGVLLSWSWCPLLRPPSPSDSVSTCKARI